MPLPKAKVTVNRRPMLMPSDSAIRRLSTAARICAPIRVRSKASQRPTAITMPIAMSTMLYVRYRVIPRLIWPCRIEGSVRGWFSGPTRSVTEAVMMKTRPMVKSTWSSSPAA